MSLEYWQKEEPSGRKITMEKGERYTQWLRRQPGRGLHLGLTVRSVCYGDHRSGWSAIVLTLNLIWWSYTWRVFKWPTKYGSPVRVITLAEQLRKTHGPTDAELRQRELEEQAEREDEKAQLALAFKRIKEFTARQAALTPEEDPAKAAIKREAEKNASLDVAWPTKDESDG